MRWRKKWLNIFSSLYYTNFTAAKVWQENEKNYSVIHMNWSVFPKNHPGNSLSINTLVYLTNMREKLPSERTQPSIPTARARILGQQADPQTLANPHAHIKRPARLQLGKPSEDLPYGQSGIGLLSFCLRKLQHKAKNPQVQEYPSIRPRYIAPASRLK